MISALKTNVVEWGKRVMGVNEETSFQRGCLPPKSISRLSNTNGKRPGSSEQLCKGPLPPPCPK